MAKARGTLVLNTIAFVREKHGPEAHERVVASLGTRHAAAIQLSPREAGWVDVDVILAYMEAAHRLLAPDDPGFYREIGRFAGQRDRDARAFGIMVGDFATAMRLASILWRAFFDVGDLEVVDRDATGATLHIRNFPTHRILCQRIVGSLEGQLSRPESPVRVEERACVLDGAPCCELRLDWTPAAAR